MALSKGHMHHEHKEGSCKSKKVPFCSNKVKLHGFLTGKSKDLNSIINKKIDKVFSHQKKKEKVKLNKFEALSILSGSNTGDSNSKFEVSHTSNEGSDSK
eukprot:8226105-Ditylum_brightwellii.AAC.1